MRYTVSLLVVTFCLALTKNVKIVRAAAVASDLLPSVAAADSAALVATDVAAPAAAAAAQPSAVNAAYSTDLLAVDSNSGAAHENESTRKARHLFYPYGYGGYGGYGGYYAGLGYGYGYGYPGYYGYGGYYPYYGYAFPYYG